MSLLNQVIDLIMQNPALKVTGAQSMYLSNKNPNIEIRNTIDLDIRICIDLMTANDATPVVELLQNNGLDVEYRKMQNNYRLIVKNEIETLRMDVELKESKGIAGNVRSIDENLHDKLPLAMAVKDRGYKNVVDVVTCLLSKYPDGITKQLLLNTAENKIVPVDIENLLDLAEKFKPNTLNGLTMQEHAIWFDTMVNGLLDVNIAPEAIFKDGKWLEAD